MRSRLVFLAFLSTTLGCKGRSPARPTPSAAPRILTFDQTKPTTTNAPRLEADLTIPSGTEEWTLSLSCTEEHGGPCPRAAALVQLAVSSATAPPVHLSMRASEAPGETVVPMAKCFEDSVEGPHSACTLQTSTGWSEDRARVLAQPPQPGPRHDFRVRITNDGPPIAARLQVSVIDPLE